jgi:hypothetical protein
MPLAFALMLLTDCAIALTPAVHDAREKARRAACTNNTYLHFGAHDGDSVTLDREGNITEVWSCPHCAAPSDFPFLVADFYREGPGSEKIPQSRIPETIRHAARARLDEYKRADWYRWYRDRFSPRPTIRPIAAGPTSPGC